ncbi:MAG: ATP-binding protein [Candidatus Latescibacterota bacterium]
MRFFNTAGPVDCQEHYCIPPLERLGLDEILMLIAQRKYLVLHAPRQTGKTSCLLALMGYLNEAGQHRALYANVEGAQAMREDVPPALRLVVQTIALRAQDVLGDREAKPLADSVLASTEPGAALEAFLTAWSQGSDRPTVLVLDEVDALVGDTLISLLRQLRGGYDKRPSLFPQSIILCGVRDVRDYRIHSDREKAIITGGSAFNIKAKSLRLGDFTRDEVERLYAQLTAETGQVFTADALDAAWELSCGQPWVVNALAYETCFEMKDNRDRTRPIAAETMLQAKEHLIERRETHLDQLADKLREARVRRVVQPMLAGETLDETALVEDLQYVLDLGLVRRGPEGPQMANGIYREVIPRELTYITQLNFEATVRPVWYVRPDGRLDMVNLLEGFQEFFREHAEHWVERFDYKEAGLQLLLQAFLQRIVNGGGRVEREYGLGRRRTDLLVVWTAGATGEAQKAVIELKVLHHSMQRTIQEGLAQTVEYVDRCGAEEAHLVVFDRAPGKSWEEKLFRQEQMHAGRTVTIWGM